MNKMITFFDRFWRVCKPRLVVTLFACGLLFVFGLDELSAASTESVSVDSQSDFAAGESKGVMVTPTGGIVPGIDIERVDLKAVHALDADWLGKSVVVALGEPARILKVDGAAVLTLAKSQAVAYSAIAVVEGDVYAAELPGGKIIRIRGGKVTDFATLPSDTYVWDLQWDAKRQRLFAATGPNGKLFSIDQSGKESVYASMDVNHLLSLAFSNGDVLVGTDKDGKLFRVAPGKKAEVIQQFSGFGEISSIAVSEGLIYVAANKFRKQRGKPPGSGSRMPVRAVGGSGAGALFRVGADGVAELLGNSKQGAYTDIAITKNGVFVTSRAGGQVFKIFRDALLLFADVEERMSLAYLEKDGQSVFLSNDSAALYRQKGKATKATWVSKVLDTKTRSRFGQLAWRGAGRIEFQTRSGITSKPDESWSEWSRPMSVSGPVRSQANRYVQVKATLGSDAELYGFKLYYLPTNRKADLESVVVQSRNGKTGQYKLQWKVKNPDGDKLRYRLSFRREDQSRWRSIEKESEVVTKTQYTWDTSGLPDGYYLVRVMASDELSNSNARRRVSELVSEPIVVDNHPPKIEGLRLEGRTVKGTASDSVGPIEKLEVSLDGGDWEMILPESLIFDTARESFSYDLPAGTFPIVSIRATDAAGMTASGEIQVNP